MKLNLFLLILLTSFPHSLFSATGALSEPISFLGINWDMTEEDMVSRIESQGYICSAHSDDLLGEYVSCINGKAVVEILPRHGVIEFNCYSYHVCNLTQDELSARFVSKELVYEMLPEGDDYYGGSKYCGNGVKGDSVCIDSTNHTFLHKGSLESTKSNKVN